MRDNGSVPGIMPPTIGAAMRLITSMPVPVPHMMGSRPAMMATALELDRLPRVVQVDQHDDPSLGRHAGQRNKADRHRDRQVVVEKPHQPDAADQRERD